MSVASTPRGAFVLSLDLPQTATHDVVTRLAKPIRAHHVAATWTVPVGANLGQLADVLGPTSGQPGVSGELAAVSPSGRVPVLHHNDLVIWDSFAICEYVAELYPDAKLWPSDRATRAKARAISAEMHSGFAPLRRDMPMDILATKLSSPPTRERISRANSP